jgi:uncharacterized membrane protein
MEATGMSDGDSSRGGLSKSRIEALTDGVFAIAMTLLVFGIRVPQLARPPGPGQLWRSVVALWPQLLSYVMSFVILGIYWIGHHNQFHYIRRSDRTLLWINIAFLMSVTFIPFTTALLGDYPAERISVVIYGVNLIIVGFFLYLHWAYATGPHRLIDSNVSPAVIRLAKQRIMAAPVIIAASILLSLYVIRLSLLLYILVLFYYILPGKIDRAWTPRPEHAQENLLDLKSE